jgi:hypothetical protein
MTLPPVSFELVRRLEHAALRFSVARLEAIRDRPETGLDLRIKRFGAAIAPASPAQRPRPLARAVAEDASHD